MCRVISGWNNQKDWWNVEQSQFNPSRDDYTHSHKHSLTIKHKDLLKTTPGKFDSTTILSYIGAVKIYTYKTMKIRKIT